MNPYTPSPSFDNYHHPNSYVIYISVHFSSCSQLHFLGNIYINSNAQILAV